MPKQMENKMKVNTLTKVSGVLAIASLALLPLEKSHAITADISGHIETTYMYDFNDPSTQATGFLTYHPTANSFYLNNAHVAISGELDDGVGYVLEIDHGSDANVQQNFGAADETDVQEAYINFPLGPVAFTMGKFVTYEGIEVIEGPDNPTISRGYLYGLAEAFTHVGAKAHMAFGEMIDVGVGVVNGRDQDRDNNQGKTVLWRVGFDFGDSFPLGFGISGSHGSVNANAAAATSDEDQLTSLDLTGTFSGIPMFPINFQVLFAEQDNAKVTPTGGATSLAGSWSGFGIQPVLEVNDAFSVGFRIEYIDNHDTSNYNATNYTITPTYKLNDSITLRAEVRQDNVNDTQVATGSRFFVDDKGMAEDSQTTALFGVSVGFGGDE